MSNTDNVKSMGKNGRPVALVTGAARGIGHGIACALAGKGFDIVVADLQPADKVEAAMQEIRQNGVSVVYQVCDVANRANRENMVAAIKQEFGALHVLVNNAGVAPTARVDLLEATEESYERVMRINLQGPYFLTQLIARWMVEQKKADEKYWGCIINLSSISSEVASINRGEYCLSKAGVSMATKLWAARLGEFDLPVYEIRPGIIASDMTATVQEKYNKLIDEGLLVQKRWGYPADVGRAAAMLATQALVYSSGQVIFIDGGYQVQRL